MKLALAILLLPSLASAEAFQLGVNMPAMWGHSVGVSLAAGVTDHQAIRVGYMRHDEFPEDLFIAAAFGGDESGRFGTTTDGSVTWVYYPRAVFDGFSIEAGALYRRRNNGEYPYEQDRTTLVSQEVAARAQIGWSWLLWKHASISIAAGMSVGREYGTSTDTHTQMDTAVARWDHQVEGMLRFGAVFDL